VEFGMKLAFLTRNCFLWFPPPTEDFFPPPSKRRALRDVYFSGRFARLVSSLSRRSNRSRQVPHREYK
jgi:hypothetical protein